MPPDLEAAIHTAREALLGVGIVLDERALTATTSACAGATPTSSNAAFAQIPGGAESGPTEL